MVSKQTISGDKSKQAESNYKVVFTNINGIISGLRDLNIFIERESPDIIGLAEIKLYEELEEVEKIGLSKYNIWKRIRSNKRGGGVMLLVRKDLKVTEVYYGEGLAEVIKICVENSKGSKRQFIVTYVPPKTNAWTNDDYKTLINDTKVTLEEMMKDDKIIMMGDFNCREVCWEEWYTVGSESSWGYNLLQLAIDNVLTQWIKCDTRFGGEGESSRLDLIFSKEQEAIGNVWLESPLSKSDHATIVFTVNEERKIMRSEEHRERRLNYSKTDFNGLRNFFQEKNWDAFYNASNVQEKWSEFLNIYREGENNFVPKRKPGTVGKNDWFNRKCETARRVKEEAWNRWRRNRRPNLWNKYKLARNEYVTTLREEQKKFESDIIDRCKNEPKLFYRYVNGKVKTNKSLDKIRVEEVIYEGPKVIAQEMNLSFKKVFTNEKEFTRPSHIQMNTVRMEDIHVTVKEVDDIIRNVDGRKATGPDGVSGWILKECRHQLSDKLHNIISSSLNEGKIPKDWKRANIVPIFKGGDPQKPLNYRPVSLTSVVAKICERVIKNKWAKFLEDNGLLSDCQFGFRKGRSCTTNLLCYYSRIVDIIQEREGWADGIYLDLMKAFDKVPHKRLLWKLERMGGIGGKLLEWMEDFLVGREMRTVIRDQPSEWGKVTSGVPQGSVLAPAMFAVYINDMGENVSSYISLFADDAKLLRKVVNYDDCRELQNDIDRVSDWSTKWQMQFNIGKCKKIEFGKSSKRCSFNYKLGPNVIKKASEEKDLGVICDEDLSPEKHINKITGESMNLLKNIRTAFAYLDESMMKKIITTMIRPRLEYAAIIWSPHEKKHIRKLERVQRAATKMVPELQDLTYEERLTRMELSSLEKRRERGDLIAMYRLIKGIDKLDRYDLLIMNERDTRGHGKKIKPSTCRRDTKKFSFPHRSIKLWNEQKEEVVCANNLHSFKKKLDANGLGDGTARA